MMCPACDTEVEQCRDRIPAYDGRHGAWMHIARCKCPTSECGEWVDVATGVHADDPDIALENWAELTVAS